MMIFINLGSHFQDFQKSDYLFAKCKGKKESTGLLALLFLHWQVKQKKKNLCLLFVKVSQSKMKPCLFIKSGATL
jgi:hypothetical protein